MAMPVDDLSKPKFKGMFDVVVVGFIHSGLFAKDVYDLVKEGGELMAEKSRYLVPKKKEERKEIDEKMRDIIEKAKGFQQLNDGVDYYRYRKVS